MYPEHTWKVSLGRPFKTSEIQNQDNKMVVNAIGAQKEMNKMQTKMSIHSPELCVEILLTDPEVITKA